MSLAFASCAAPRWTAALRHCHHRTADLCSRRPTALTRLATRTHTTHLRHPPSFTAHRSASLAGVSASKSTGRRPHACSSVGAVAMAGSSGGTSGDGKAILVTGGNDGIGLALCRQLATEEGCRVLMGSRNKERGEAAVASIELPEGYAGSVEMVQVDVSEDGSVKSAAEAVAGLLGESKLYAIVNNAGIGLSADLTAKEVVNTNLYGTKRVCEAFIPLLSPTEGRIVNVGSGGGPNYVSKCPPEAQAFLCNPPRSWNDIEAWVTGEFGIGSPMDMTGGYGVSKALVTCYTMLLAREFPQFTVSCITPGYILTKLTAGRGATKAPEDGTLSLKHALFADLPGSGFYYGSDGVRSPLHFMRNPGEPAYDGVPPHSPAST